MNFNIGTFDRIVRLVIAVAIVVPYFLKFIHGTAAVIFGIIAGICIISGLIGWSPVYALFGISTNKSRKTH